MSRSFLKMNGLGNAFAVVDARQAPFRPTPEAVRAWAGVVHFDQLIAVEPSEQADVFMRVWNADGGQVETCGNALRCIGWLGMEETGRSSLRIDTAAGLVEASRAGPRSIAVDMGAPRLDWRDIPLAEEMDTRGIELQVGPIDEPHLHTPGAVSMGNPHVVFFVKDAEAAPVREAGSLI
jgi:diaminopimelate epimerase